MSHGHALPAAEKPSPHAQGTPSHAGHAAAQEQGAHAGHAMHGAPACGAAAPGQGTSVDLPADAAPRTPVPALTAADRAAAFPAVRHGHASHDRSLHAYWLADRLEWRDDGSGPAWEGLAWIGGDLDRLWLRSEGEAGDDGIEHGEVEVFYGRSLTPWWDLLAGLRHDIGEGPSRTWLALGVQGLAPYKFEVDATLYLGHGGRSAAVLEAEYDTLLTGRLVLQWQAAASLHGRDDAAAGIGSGLSTVEAGARLRYEITRRFAPYVGVEFERAFGDTAQLRRAHGEPDSGRRVVAGVRFWF